MSYVLIYGQYYVILLTIYLINSEHPSIDVRAYDSCYLAKALFQTCGFVTISERVVFRSNWTGG